MSFQQSPPVDKARISSNQLGEYIFSSASKKIQILKDQKLGNPPKQSYYGGAMHGILGSFSKEAGKFDLNSLREKIREISAQSPKNRNQGARFSNNAEMLKRFTDLSQEATPPRGQHDVVYQNARLELGGVIVSVRPEIITKSREGRSIALTKLRFSKSNISADTSEIILLILLEYGHSLVEPEVTLDLKQTKIVDCYANAVVRGHQLPAIRTKQLNGALGEIARIWPNITSSSRYADFF